MHLASIIGIFGIAAISIIFSLVLYRTLLKKPDGNKKTVDVANAIRGEIVTFFKRQHLALASVVAIILALTLYAFGWKMAISFLAGAVASAFLGSLSATLSAKMNSRAAEALRLGTKNAFNIKFKSGLASGLTIASFGLIFILGLYLLFGSDNLVGFALGSALVSIFSRLSGGVFAKAADIGADFSSELESGFSEDDPRNPATIPDSAGDSISDNGGNTQDLFALFSASAITAMLISSFINDDKLFVIFPLVLVAAGTMLWAVSSFIVFLWKNSKNIMAAFYRGFALSGVLSAVAFYFLTRFLTKENGAYATNKIYFSELTGLLVVLLTVWLSVFLISRRSGLIKEIVNSSKANISATVIAGLGASLRSAAYPALIIAAAVAGAYTFTGFYGVVILCASVASTTALIISANVFGSMADISGVIARTAAFSSDVQEDIKCFDRAGNSLKAMSKSVFTTITPIALLGLLYYVWQIYFSSGQINLVDPKTIIGIILGGIVPYYVCSSIIEAVGKAATKVEKEAKAQIESKPIKQGAAPCDSRKVTEIASRISINRAYLPLAIGIIAPLAIGYILGGAFMPGFIVGSIIVGAYLSLQLTIGGGVLEGAKKEIELDDKSNLVAIRAGIIGDTIGDSYKDAAGPVATSLSLLVTLISLLALMLLTKYALPYEGKIIAIGVLIIVAAAFAFLIPKTNE